MRITTNAILRNYRSNLGTSMANLDTARNKVMTGRQFVSSAENPGSALRAATQERKYLKKNDYLEMDIHSIRNLELVETLRLKERTYSLLWLLDKCKTAMGSRKLKNWMLNPLKNKEKIIDRYEKVEKLNNEFIIKDELKNYLYEVYDIERLSGNVINGSLSARDL